jgi:Kef-type K+ transport system membrane component KefB/Trk K+ transport system NAD-binding subunit
MNRQHLYWRSTTGIFSLMILPAQAIAGGGELPPLVHDIGLSLLLSSILVVVFHRLKLPSIAAFLAAGVIAGPLGLDVISNKENIDTIAQLGLVLLLFVIGLELDLRKLLSSSKTLILTGFLQFPLHVIFGVVFGGLLVLTSLGATITEPGETGYVMLYLGIVMATSSTLLVVKLFQTSFLMDTRSGRISIGLLIFQDIWVILIIAVQPNFADPSATPIVASFAAVVILILIAAVLARYILPTAFRWIAKVPELIIVAALGWCFAVVFLGANIDYLMALPAEFEALPLTVGAGMSALIAGACIASFPYSTDLVGRVGLLKDFFVALFFVGLGLAIPMPHGPGMLQLAVLIAVLVLLARLVIFFPLLYWAGLDRRNAMVSSLRLAQISEFSLIICYAGLGLGHITPEFNSVIIFAFILTALWTPLLFSRADTLYTHLEGALDRLGFQKPDAQTDSEKREFSVALLGFHRLAASLLHELARTSPEILENMLVVDFNVHIHGQIAAYGPVVRYGNLANSETLQHAGVDKARVVLITLQDDFLIGTSNYAIIESVRKMNSTATIIAHATKYREIKGLYKAGADFVYLTHVETARSLVSAISSALEGNIDLYRSENEGIDETLHERNEIVS